MGYKVRVTSVKHPKDLTSLWGVGRGTRKQGSKPYKTLAGAEKRAKELKRHFSRIEGGVTVKVVHVPNPKSSLF
jgi:hypothetical protein